MSIEQYSLKPSYSQERFWFLHNLEPNTPTYNISKVIRLTGELNKEIWKYSLGKLVERHEILRTNFSYEEDLKQNIKSYQECSYDFFEMSEVAAKKEINEFVKKSFDLENDKLFAAKLIKFAKNDYYFALNIHHILCDGTSIGILIRDLYCIYNEEIKHTEKSSLPELNIQFADYAEWERETSNKEELEKSLDFWKTTLQDEQHYLSFTNEKKTNQKIIGETKRFSIPLHISNSVTSLTKNNKTTLFITLLTAFKVLLYKYTSQKDISIGSPISVRENKQLEDVVGLFINTVIFKSKIDPTKKFEDNLRHIHKMALGVYEHKKVPFDLVVKEINPNRNVDNMLFNVMFALHYSTKKPKLYNLESREINIDNKTTKFDMSLTIVVDQQELYAEVEYNTNLFSGEFIDRMFNIHFLNLLDSITKNPNIPISEIPLMSKDEKQFLMSINNSKAEVPDKCLHELFEEQVNKVPNATALTFGRTKLSYEQLNQKSNILAMKLKNKITHGMAIGIYMERSLEMIISILAILKTGGIYVPLNIEDPPERIENIIKKANINFTLINKEQRNFFNNEINYHTEIVDEKKLKSEKNVKNLHGNINPNSVVSIYFTSGSTGAPKGVVNLHKGWVNRMNCMQRAHNLQVGDTVLQKTLYTFDAFGLEVFWPLINGGNVCLLEPGEHRNPRAIIDAMINYNVIFLQVVPSMLNEIINEVDVNDVKGLSSLKFIASAGEPLTSKLYRKIKEKINCSVYNTWGPTEASIDVTQYLCEEEDLNRDSVISIGKPMENNKVYILDEHLKQVPIGVVGDIYVSGVGLGKGYVGDYEKSMKSFITNPFEPELHMYRTGDRGYFSEDGNIQFVGREDNQIKLRGMRVELGEIEQTLNNFHMVNQAIVKIFKERDSENQIVAYYTLKNNDENNAAELRNYLAARLPNYMIPSYFIKLDKLPVLPNGKVNRNVLPKPDMKKIFSESTQISPRNQKELLLIQIWSEILEHDGIGVESNFFEVGGHSLKAIQLMNKVKKEFEVSLPLNVIFENPTLEKLCGILDNKTDSTKDTFIFPLHKGGVDKAPLFLIHPGGGGILCYYNFVQKMQLNRSIYGIQSIGYDDDNIPLNSVKEMATKYIEGIKKIQPKGPYFIAGWSFGGTISFEIAHQLELLNEKVEFLGLIDTYPIDNTDDKLQVAQTREDPLNAWAARLNIDFKEFRSGEYEEKVLFLHNEVIKQKMLPLDSSINNTKKLLEIMTNNNFAAENFSCNYKIDQDIFLFNVKEISKMNQIPLVDVEIWKRRTKKEIKELFIEGNHHNLMSETKVESLANKFKDILKD
ncbi:non-ribosomal peptide synthetase [Peribacillus simplex]|uniref:non-ribosomal peptide synthetase n=1 Tax=Peribacillus simplex TaxID=1478 RepID=UPI003D2D798C